MGRCLVHYSAGQLPGKTICDIMQTGAVERKMKLRLPALALLVMAVITGTASAETYANARYDFAVDVPGDLSVAAPEPDSGDGRSFRSPDNSAELLVFGGWNVEGGFDTEVQARQKFETEEGWEITYASKLEKEGSSYSGAKENRIFYARIIPRCGDSGFAMYRLEYPAAEKEKYDAAINQLNASLKAGSEGCS
jgi:hypothetical protein